MGSDERSAGVDDVATHVGVGRATIYRWIEHRGLPARKVGRLLRFERSQVDAWVDEGSGEGERHAPPIGSAK